MLLKKSSRNMKYLYLLLLAVFVLSCGKGQKPLYLSLSNPLDTIRTDESFVLDRKQLGVDEKCRLVPILIDESGRFVPCQYDDLDCNAKCMGGSRRFSCNFF